jgi:C1A family cysteine protease
MKKTTKVLSEFLALCLVISFSIMLIGSEISEKNVVSDVQRGYINSYETAISQQKNVVPDVQRGYINSNETAILQQKNVVSAVQRSYINSNETAISQQFESAPENLEFVKYKSNKILTQSVRSHNKYNKTEIIPSPVNLHHLRHVRVGKVSASAYSNSQNTNDVSKISSVQAKSSAPANFDLRTLNKVTTVKDEVDARVCWAFATFTSLESYLMPGEDWDFSENNLKNLLSFAYPGGFDRNPNDGGNAFMSTAYLTRWSGPVVDRCDPYGDTSSFSPTGLPVCKHVQDVLFLSERQDPQDNQEIKWAVQNYGAVFTQMYYDPAFYSPATNSYYYDGSSDSNHAMDIVGWNDSFDKSLFLNVPPGNGAFIIKNNWGTDWGDRGYFYISYYDSNIGKDNYLFTAESPYNYKYIYQYDPLGWTQDIGNNDSIGWCANVFTAKSDEILKAVSFYTTDSSCKYEVYIYTNSEYGPLSKAGPIVIQSGTSPIAGYHTVHLNSGVHLQAGKKFSVVLKFMTSGYGYPIAIEEPIANYSSKATANLGESFVSSDGTIWTDVVTHYPNTNVCIKAFAD